MDIEAIEKLKSETKIGDTFDIYYLNEMEKPHAVKVVSKVTDKSIFWLNESGYIQRESWNTVLGYIKKGIFRKK